MNKALLYIALIAFTITGCAKPVPKSTTCCGMYAPESNNGVSYPEDEKLYCWVCYDRKDLP